ncbi:MAG: sugar phosphate isomerase/epimerase [Candidatus Omnitrophica bacterium]|nr:sugar phosphate isomerase/epimerase [Candidatus Omnitrophota bacterium]
MEIDKSKVFVSTRAFCNNNLAGVLELCQKQGISNLELGSNLRFVNKNISDLMYFKNCFKGKLLIHNYFPSPQKAFVINLASSDKGILKKSKQHCLRAIKLCAKLKVPFYSVHSGFCFEAAPNNLGKKLTRLPRISLAEAEDIFVNSLRELSHLSASYGVEILIENNVVTLGNTINSKNLLMLGVSSEDLLRILKKAGADNISILLDIAHLKVSANSLGFSPVSFIKDIKRHVRALHLSDNDGKNDQHLSFSDKSWFVPFLGNFKGKYLIIECDNLQIKDIFKCRDVICGALQ